jgi:hypothetical protein
VPVATWYVPAYRTGAVIGESRERSSDWAKAPDAPDAPDAMLTSAAATIRASFEGLRMTHLLGPGTRRGYARSGGTGRDSRGARGASS